MLAYDPKNRLTLQQIKEDKWYTGDILMMDEVKKEFRKRKEKVDGELEKQRMAKLLEREKQKLQQAQAQNQKLAYTGIKGFRSLTDEKKEFENVESAFAEELKLSRQIKQRESNVPWKAQDFVSVCDADYLLKVVLNVLLSGQAKKEIIDIKLSPESYKISTKFPGEDEFIEIGLKLSAIDEETNIVEFNRKSVIILFNLIL